MSDAELDEARKRIKQLERHIELLRSWIKPRHRYALAVVGDDLVMRCTDHDEEVARWIADGGRHAFQPIDDAAHAHEVWHHGEMLRGGVLVDETAELFEAAQAKKAPLTLELLRLGRATGAQLGEGADP